MAQIVDQISSFNQEQVSRFIKQESVHCAQAWESDQVCRDEAETKPQEPNSNTYRRDVILAAGFGTELSASRYFMQRKRTTWASAVIPK